LLLTACRSTAEEPGGAARAEPSAGASDPAPTGTGDAARAPAAPVRPHSFNERVLDLIGSYPTEGGYAWPAPAGTHGTTRDLYLGETRIARASGDGSHCSGLTFEVFWRVLEGSPGGPTGAGLTPARAKAFLRAWFVPEARGLGPAEALPAFDLGVRISDLEQARPGDFIQMWMNNGRGHTAVFLGWVRDETGRIIASRHWSTHPATGGIGVEKRAIGTGPRDIDRDAIYIGRAMPGAR